MKLKQLLFILMCALFATNFYAIDYYVKAGGDNTNDGLTEDTAFATVVHAFSQCISGDVIKVVGTLSSSNASVVLSGGAPNRSITIEGTDATATISDYNSTGRSFLINTPGYTGTITFRNLIFSNNTTSSNNGAAVFLNNQTGATVIFENCTFSGNSATTNHANNGGGAINMINGNLTITNCNFSNNTTVGPLGGGAIYISNAVATLTGSTFYNNTTTNATVNLGRGGAINFNGTASGNLTNCTFFENKVAQTGNFHGAAIRVNATGNSVTVSNSLFYNNKSQSGAGVNSDFNGPVDATMNITNSLAQFQLNADTTTGSTITNSDFLATSTLTWNGTLNKVTFTAPSLLTDATPIDFGSDFSDVGSWDSKINLFKTGSDWATGSNWSSTAVPTALENVTLLSDSPALILGSSTTSTINNLSVNAASSLTINSGGSLIVNGTSTGNVTYKRNLPTTNWYLVSSPVSGQAYNDAYVTANDIASGAGNNRGIAFYATLNNGWAYFQAGGNDTFIDGIGYSVKRATAGDISFTGTINTNNVLATFVNNGSNGFNLLGNPYTSHINSATFLTGNTANLVSETIWVWNQATSNYETKVTGDGFVLAPTQGFFVRSSTGTNLTFAESNQASTGGIFQKSAKTEVKLMMTDGTADRFARVNYVDNATTGFDNGYDGETFGGIVNSVDVFTHLVSNSEGKKFQVQSLPNSDFENMVVPVGVKAAAGKEITFSVEANNIPDGINVYLEDKTANTVTLLSEANATYKVTLNESLDGIGRFYLHTKASGVLGTETVDFENVSVYAINNNTLRVVGIPSGNSSVKLFTILGKQVMQTSFSSTGVQDISLPKLATGMYIIQLETASGKLNKKIVLE